MTFLQKFYPLTIGVSVIDNSSSSTLIFNSRLMYRLLEMDVILEFINQLKNDSIPINLKNNSFAWINVS